MKQSDLSKEEAFVLLSPPTKKRWSEARSLIFLDAGTHHNHHDNDKSVAREVFA
jgi:hypothetical protein